MFRVIVCTDAGRERLVGTFASLDAARREADWIIWGDPLVAVYVTH